MSHKKSQSHFNEIGSSVVLQDATLSEAAVIAKMSRDQIEAGLGWSWTPERVTASIKRSNSIVLKASKGSHFLGFGIMSLNPAKANLNLLAIRPEFKRQGIGRRLLESLEEKALVSGIENFYVQVRETNEQALRFYHRFGYEMIDRNREYYKKREAAVILYKYCPKLISAQE